MLPSRTVNWSEHIRELRAALDDVSSMFYFDTSFLLGFGSPHPSARKALHDWMAGLEGKRLHVPAWVVQEVYRLASKPVTPMARISQDLLQKCVDLKIEARRFVDDATAARFQDGHPLPGRDRPAFLIGLDADVDRLFSKAAYLKRTAGERHDEVFEFITNFVNGRLLPARPYAAMATTEAEFDVRLDGGNFPGSKNKKKESNRYGDYLIWREIVAHCAGQGEALTSVVLFTNDVKQDWVFRPTQVVGPGPHGRSTHCANLVNRLVPIGRAIGKRCRISSAERKLVRDTEANLRDAAASLEALASSPHDIRARGLMQASIERALMCVERDISVDKMAAVRSANFVLRVASLRNRLEELPRVDRADKPFASDAERRGCERVRDLIYECSSNRATADRLVGRILAKL